MASTVEMFVAGTALIVNTIIIIVMYFINNAVLGPFLDAVSKLGMKQVFPMSDMTWVFPYIFAMLLIFEIIIIIAFFAVLARRAGYEYEY
jgi:hypothetical protein